MRIPTDIQSLFVLVVIAFTLGSTLLSTYSIVNVLRLRNVRMSWSAGKLWGYPLFATLFLTASLILAAIVYQQSLTQYYFVSACYVWIGGNWFIASYLASRRYITDHGIVKNISDPSQTVAWFQVTDFVEKAEGKGKDYVFIYQNGSGMDIEAGDTDEKEEYPSCHACIRLELRVPAHNCQEFNKVLSYKLKKTISPELATLTDRDAVE